MKDANIEGTNLKTHFFTNNVKAYNQKLGRERTL